MSAETARRTETIPEWKQAEVDELIAFLEEYESVGIVDVTGIPSRQLQQMRAELRGHAALRISRNTLINRALDTVDDGLEALTDEVSGQIGLIGTNANPFVLYRRLEASKTPAPINPGEVAPNDIVIPAGDTGIDPGPFIGELQNVGAAAQIMEGSIRVTKDSVVATAGETVSDQLANVLSELGMEPKEVGLNLRAVYADDVIFEATDLAIDIDEYRADIQAAAATAHTLAVETAIPTAQTTPALLQTGHQRALALGVAAAITIPELVDDLVRHAHAQSHALGARLPAEFRPGDLADGPAQAATAEPDEPDDDQPSEPPTPDTHDDADDADDADDDDDDAMGEGLGAMFG